MTKFQENLSRPGIIDARARYRAAARRLRNTGVNHRSKRGRVGRPPIGVMIPEAVQYNFWLPDDEHMVLETCRGMK